MITIKIDMNKAKQFLNEIDGRVVRTYSQLGYPPIVCLGMGLKYTYASEDQIILTNSRVRV